MKEGGLAVREQLFKSHISVFSQQKESVVFERK